MVQILFGLGTDLDKADWLHTAIRTLFGMFDQVVYTLITYVYQILFAIADSGIISSTYLSSFYERFQVILGVFMIFKLAVSVLQYVVNPDLMSDKKQGISNVITRIITMLAMLMAIMPLNIPDSNAPAGSYNAYLNENGLLFGTMYSLQSRILNQGVLEKLIFGDKQLLTGDEDSTLGTNPNASSDADAKNNIDVEQSANQMAVGLLKVFIRPNLVDVTKGDEDDENFVCCVENDLIGSGCSNITDGSEEWKKTYDDEDGALTPDILVGLLDTKCGKGYALAYMPIIPTVCGALILWVLVTFCIEVAKRAIRLAILRLIAPIPIISYVDPKSSEKGAFAAWTKELITAFLQLFIALAIIFFSINIVTYVMNAFVGAGTLENFANDVVDLPNPFDGGISIVNSVAIVFIVLAIFLFAKEAPRFIMNALGIKGTGYGLGFGAALGGLGAMMGGAGLRGLLSGSTGAMKDESNAYVQSKAAPPAFGSQRDNVIRKITGDDKAEGGLLGAANRRFERDTMSHLANNLFGIGRNSIPIMKNRMFRLEDQLAHTEGFMDRLSKDPNSLSAAEKQKVADDGYGTYNAATGVLTMSTTQRDEYMNVLQKRRDKLKTDYGIAKSDFDKADKIATRMGVNPTSEEKFRRSVRDETYHAIRHPIDRHLSNQVMGQSMGDRMTGRNSYDRMYDNMYEHDIYG